MVLNVKTGIFNRYKKLSLLGKGAYGQVFKVQHTGNAVVRALKVIDKKLTRTPT
jgi:serine/threonine protein kinase